MHQEWLTRISREAFLKSLHRAGFKGASADSIDTRPYRYRKDGIFLAAGFFQPRPRDGRCDMYIVHATSRSGSSPVIRIRHDEYRTWELSLTPIPDSVVWFLGDIVCKSIRSFTALCECMKGYLLSA
ncbi:MAG: hypothetical protein WCJ25_00230 [Candidatus Moraniibacteriota bacterium]